MRAEGMAASQPAARMQWGILRALLPEPGAGGLG